MGESLLPLERVRGHLTVLGQHYAGVQEIPIDRIVGTVDRAVDFDAFFRPRRRDLRRRLDALATEFADRPMPPITVYEAGGLYFVADGHHRVALARRDRAESIDAEVTSVQVSHRLHPGVDVLDLVTASSIAASRSGPTLMEVAPEAPSSSRPVGYGELAQVVEAHAYALSESAGSVIPMAEATRDWCTRAAGCRPWR